jgi:hypothetical protein
MTIWRSRISHWVPQARNTHSRNVLYLLLSTTTMIARSRLYGKLCVYCLSFILYVFVCKYEVNIIVMLPVVLHCVTLGP